MRQYGRWGLPTMIDDETRAIIHEMWDALADFDAVEVEKSRNHLLGRLCALLGAHNATWIGAVRMPNPSPDDPVRGWRPRALRRLHLDPKFELAANEQAKRLEAGIADVTTLRVVAQAGTFRVNLLADLAPEGWFDGDFYRSFYLESGHCDAIWAAVPINEDAETYFGFYRRVGEPRFGPVERDIVDFALRGLRWFHRLQMLGEGIGVASAPLTPTERRVLHGLLQGLAEKQIAQANAQSPHTTHEYVKRIFRKYGVSSRSALMALWLGKPPPPD